MEMISKSMQALLSQNSVIRAMFEEGERLRGEYGSDKVYDFSLGNPNVPAPAFIKEAVLDIMTEMEPQAVHGYTVAPGNLAVRETLAADLNARFGTHFSGKNLFMTAGAAG